MLAEISLRESKPKHHNDDIKDTQPEFRVQFKLLNGKKYANTFLENASVFDICAFVITQV